MEDCVKFHTHYLFCYFLDVIEAIEAAGRFLVLTLVRQREGELCFLESTKESGMILSCFNGSLRNNICFPRIYVADLSIHGKKTHGITWNQEDTINLVKVLFLHLCCFCLMFLNKV